MSAEDHVSPQQFGFSTAEGFRDTGALDSHANTLISMSPKTKKLDIIGELHSRQGQMDPKVVDRYMTSSRNTRPGNPLQVEHYKGQHVVLNGHHRIAAAWARGQKTMKVEYYDVDALTKDHTQHQQRWNKFMDDFDPESL